MLSPLVLIEAPKLRRHERNVSMSDSFARISQRIDDLERRLTNCDSIYRMGTQIQATRNAQDRETVRAIIRKMRQIDAKLNSLEETMTQIPDLVREIVQKEMLSVPKVPKAKAPSPPPPPAQPKSPPRIALPPHPQTPKPHSRVPETARTIAPPPKTPRPKRKSMSLSRTQADQIKADVAEIEELMRQSQEDTTLSDLNSEIAKLKKIHKVDQARSYTRMKLVSDLLAKPADS